MQTSRYLFQSPYNSQVQFGRPDPSSEQNKQTQKTLDALTKDTNTISKEASTFQTSQKDDVKPSVESAHKLDIYA